MSNCKLSGKALVIQLDRDEIRVARTTLGQNAPQLQNCMTLKTPEGAVEDGAILNLDLLTDLLKPVCGMSEYKGVRKVVFSLCTTQVISETVTTPNVSGSKLEKLLQANMDMYFPVDVKDYEVVWQTIGPKGGSNAMGEQLIQLWAVPRALLSRYYVLASRCGLNVLAVDYCGHSAATAAGASFAAAKGKKARKRIDLNKEITFGKKSEAKTEAEAAVAVSAGPASDTDLYLNLEREHLMMTFVRDGQVKMQRVMQCGMSPADQLGEAMMVMEYYRSMEVDGYSEIHGFVSGGLAEDDSLVAEVEDALGIRTAPVPGVADPKFALCVGAAATSLDFGSPDMNPKSNVRKSTVGQWWQYLLIIVGGAAVVLVMFNTMGTRVTWESTIASLENTEMQLRIEAQKNAGYANNYYDYESAYNRYVSDRETVFANLRTYNDNLNLMLGELENVVPETTSVTQIGIAPDGLTLTFACPTKEEAAYLIMALRELQYADLLSISNLSGGGAGASAPILPQDGNEAPPTEGSSLTDTLLASVSKEELLNLMMSLTPEEVYAFESSYGAQPTVETKLEDITASFDQRKTAISDMLGSNPFAAYRFIELVKTDMLRPAGTEILYNYISGDLNKPENLEMFLNIISGNISDAATMQDYQARLVNIITKDPETLAATEKLIATDTVELNWYIYYLEVVLGERTAESFPYLNYSKIISDMMNGTWPNTGNPELDEKLKAVIPTIPGLGGDGDDDDDDGDSDPPIVIPPVEDPDPTPSTPPTTDPDPGETTPPDTGDEIDWVELMEKYPGLVSIALQNPELAKKLASDPELVNFLLANPGIIEMLEKNPSLVDPILKDDMTTQQIIDYLKAEYEKYTANQTPGTDPTPGETTNPDPGESSKPDDGNGSSTTPGGDNLSYMDLIAKYPTLVGIAIQNPELAKKLAADEELLNFLLDNPEIIEMLENDPALVDDILDALNSGASTDIIMSYLWNEYTRRQGSGEGSGTGTGTGEQAQDTRIYFSVALGYRQDLIDAELLRRGLDKNDGIEKVEVKE